MASVSIGAGVVNGPQEIEVPDDFQNALLAIIEGGIQLAFVNQNGGAVITGAADSDFDELQVSYVVLEDLFEKQATTYMSVFPPDTSGGLENFKGPLVHYLWRYRANQPVLELDILLNNGTLDSEFVNPSDPTVNPLFPNQDQNVIFIEAPKGYGWVSKSSHQKVTLFSESANLYQVDLLGTKPYQGSLVWIPLYLVPTSNILDGRTRGTSVDDYINLKPYLLESSAVDSWFPLDLYSEFEVTGVTEFSKESFTSKVQQEYDRLTRNIDNPLLVPNLVPSHLEYIKLFNGQATGGNGMNHYGPAATYDRVLSKEKVYQLCIDLLLMTLHRPTRGFFNHFAAPTNMARIENDITTKDLFNESNSNGWNLSMNGGIDIFTNDGNPYGVSSITSFLPNAGIGSLGAIDVQHWGRAYNIALYMAQRFKDSFGKMLIRWFASAARIDQNGLASYIGVDGAGPYSNLARDAAFTAYICAMDWRYNKNIASSAVCTEFIETCESYQASSWAALGGDGSHSGGLNAFRTDPAPKEVNLAKEAWGWNTGLYTDPNTSYDFTQLTTSATSQVYQEMLLFEALYACSAAGFTVQDSTLSGLGNFIVDSVGPNQTSPWYRVCPSADVWQETVSGVYSIPSYTTLDGLTIDAVSGGLFTRQGGIDRTTGDGLGGLKAAPVGLTQQPNGNEYGNSTSYWLHFLAYLYSCPSSVISDATKEKAFNSLKYGGGNNSNPVNSETYTVKDLFLGQGGFQAYRDPFIQYILGQSNTHKNTNLNENVGLEDQNSQLWPYIEKEDFPY